MELLVVFAAAAAAVAAVVRVVGRMVLGRIPDSSGEYLNLLEAVAWWIGPKKRRCVGER